MEMDQTRVLLLELNTMTLGEGVGGVGLDLMDQGLELVQTLGSGLECEMDYELFFFIWLSFELMWSFIMTY